MTPARNRVAAIQVYEVHTRSYHHASEGTRVCCTGQVVSDRRPRCRLSRIDLTAKSTFNRCSQCSTSGPYSWKSHQVTTHSSSRSESQLQPDTQCRAEEAADRLAVIRTHQCSYKYTWLNDPRVTFPCQLRPVLSREYRPVLCRD